MRGAVETSLTAAARRVIAQQGLARLSLRAVARTAGWSTFSVTSSLGNKAGLLAATLADAIDDDERFHQSFFTGLSGLEPDPMHLVDIVTAYLHRRRAKPETSRVLLEMFLVKGAAPGGSVLLRDWHNMRRAAWQRFLTAAGVDAGLPALWADMLLIEEFFSSALGDSLEYDLLLRESLRALFSRDGQAGKESSASPSAVLQWLNLPEPAALYNPEVTTGVKRKLLDAAADTLIDEGFAALTNGRLSRQAGVSTSMISYHFGAMQGFVQASIVHALRRDVPKQAFYLRADAAAGPVAMDAGQWAATLSAAVQRSQAGNEARGEGFYVKYARVVAHACLLAQSQPELLELLLWLRANEGFGTYRSQELRPTELRVSRLGASHFAIWIQGYSLVNDQLCAGGSDKHAAHVLEAARCFALKARAQPVS